MMTGRPAEDLTGQQFGRLTILRRANLPGDKRGPRWISRCTCGGETEASASDFKRGNVNSCGCFRIELAKSRATHGESVNRSKEYRIWCGIKQRCLDAGCKDYARYGGRGISINPEFMAYESFLNAMGRCPVGCSIGRINNDGPYSSENCRWETARQQSNNKRNNNDITAFGECRTIAEWSRDPRCVVSYSLLKSRIGRQQWIAESAITTPPLGRKWMQGKKQNYFKQGASNE